VRLGSPSRIRFARFGFISFPSPRFGNFHMEGPGDNISEVGSTFRILHEAAMTSVRFSSISDEVQYNHAVWTIPPPVVAGADTNPTYNRLTREFARGCLHVEQAQSPNSPGSQTQLAQGEGRLFLPKSGPINIIDPHPTHPKRGGEPWLHGCIRFQMHRKCPTIRVCSKWRISFSLARSTSVWSSSISLL
jgi:hypothetical protein